MNGEPYPAAVRLAAESRIEIHFPGRLRSQRGVIRDVMLAASECDTWLTLEELRHLTHFGVASISAQLRHLRKAENGGFTVKKRIREKHGKQKTYEYRMFAERGIVENVPE